MKLLCPKVKNNYLEPVYGNSALSQVEYGIPQRSFPIEWKDIPKGTETFAIVFEDFDNIEDEGIHWIHWLVANVEKGCHYIEDDASRKNKKLLQGKTSWALPYEPYAKIPEKYLCRYGGPAPSRKHEYELTIYAVKKKLDLEKGFYYNQLRNQLYGNVLESKTIKFYYDVFV